MPSETAPDRSLARVQRWMLECIVHQGTAEEAMASREARAEIPADEARGVLLPSKTLRPAERLDIYRGMYVARMEEALAVDYPALKHFLGEDAFLKLAARYVEVHPSRSYTLNRLGDHLPAFIASLGTADLPRKDFCLDLARLELALTEVFDEAETPTMSSDAVQAVPQEAWERARLRPIAAFRLAEFAHPASQYIGAVEEENPFPRLARKKTYAAAYRRNYQVYRLDLPASAYALLGSLASRETLGDAISRVLKRTWRPALKESDLFDWFREWISEGLFQSVELT